MELRGPADISRLDDIGTESERAAWSDTQLVVTVLSLLSPDRVPAIAEKLMLPHCETACELAAALERERVPFHRLLSELTDWELRGIAAAWATTAKRQHLIASLPRVLHAS